MRRLATTAVFGLLLGAAPGLRAQPAGGGDASAAESKATARKHFLRAKELHAEGKFREAAGEYLEAYEHFPAPAFLYNVAQVYRLAKDQRTAIEYYRKYLDLEPNGEGSADAREFIETLEADLASSESGAGEATDPGGSAGEIPLEPEGSGVVAPPSEPRDDQPTPGRRLQLTGAVLGAVGIVTVGVAIGFGVKARSASNELGDFSGEWTAEQQTTYADGQAAERAMIWTATAGGAAAATGALLYYVGHRRGREHRERVGTVLSASGTGDGAVLLLRGAW